jgi:imidazolonepropionase-like amidohydrolase
MKKTITLLTSLLVLSSISQQVNAEQSYIKAGRMLDVSTGKILKDKVITINDGIITKISTGMPNVAAGE